MRFFFLCFLGLLLPTSIDISNPHKAFEIDHLGNIYLLRNSEVLKYPTDQKANISFSDPTLGEISSLDASDPHRLLLFYRDFNQLLYLDQNMAPIGNPIDLFDFSDNETELICSSHEAAFWIYNSIDQQAFRINNAGQIDITSILLNSFFTDTKITKMVEYNSDLYLMFLHKGILQLNSNGSALHKFPIADIEDFVISKHQIIYQNSKGIFEFQTYSPNDSILYRFTENGTHHFRVQNAQLFLSNEKSISIINLSF